VGPADSQAIAERFAALAPWSTRFEIGGQPFGGEIDYSGDWRIGEFFRWFGEPRTILELSSFEGAHTLLLAAPETTDRVVGLEGRPENVERAHLVAELLGRGNVEFAVENLETVDLAAYGRFDAVFCAGLLYHLERPWHLLEEIGRVTDRLFLDTHYWSGSDVVEVEGHRGGWFDEGGYEDPLSGVGTRSFWLTAPALVQLLTEAGWLIRHFKDIPEWPTAARAWLGCVRPQAGPV
jgi:SAM-dependent methyltransferase